MANNLNVPPDGGNVSWPTGSLPAKKSTSKGTSLEKNVQKAAEESITSTKSSSPASHSLYDKTIVKEGSKIDFKSSDVAVRELKAACQSMNEEKLREIIREMAPFRGDYSRTIVLMLEHGTLNELSFFFKSSAGREEFQNWPPRGDVIEGFFRHPTDRLAKAALLGDAAHQVFADNPIVLKMVLRPILKAALNANDIDLADAACRLGVNPLGFTPATLNACTPQMRRLLEEAAKKPKG